jgi:23S rRNA (cytidine1920-2'-O)/16S rRNA (cytidine1409-2'-O)-methyltransferase
MHATLPEKVALITIDVAWTRQRFILPAALKLLAPGGNVVSLVKPHYEADKSMLRRGILPADQIHDVFAQITPDIEQAGFEIIAVVDSPIIGSGGNAELLTWLKARDC